MKVKLRHIFIGFLFVLSGQIVGVKTGLYSGSKIWIDMPLHFASGILLAMFGIWLAQKYKVNHKVFYALSIALLGSFLWEIFEFLVLTYSPDTAFTYKIYSLTVSDLISDVSLGLTGGLLTGLIYKAFNKDE